MKSRNGFVSNSSSTSFILDIRQEGVEALLKNCKARRGDLFGRCTGIAYGKEVNDIIDDIIDFDDYHVEWVEGWIKKIGIENIVYLRESDEDDSQIFDNVKDYNKLHKLVLDEQEFH